MTGMLAVENRYASGTTSYVVMWPNEKGRNTRVASSQDEQKAQQLLELCQLAGTNDISVLKSKCREHGKTARKEVSAEVPCGSGGTKRKRDEEQAPAPHECVPQAQDDAAQKTCQQIEQSEQQKNSMDEQSVQQQASSALEGKAVEADVAAQTPEKNTPREQTDTPEKLPCKDAVPAGMRKLLREAMERSKQQNPDHLNFDREENRDGCVICAAQRHRVKWDYRLVRRKGAWLNGRFCYCCIRASVRMQITRSLPVLQTVPGALPLVREMSGRLRAHMQTYEGDVCTCHKCLAK